MKICRKLNLIFVFVSIFLSGCILQSRQLIYLTELINDPPMDLSENSWSVSYSDYESVVYAVSTSAGILFSNKAGDQVLFDGWVVREAKGMGRYQLNMEINDVGNARNFKRENRIVLQQSCGRWENKKKLRVVLFSQYCDQMVGDSNNILVNEANDIILIRQIVDEKYTVLTLTKLK